MKFSFRQILASAAGAVIAALIASSFGVTGTIIGVAIGSMAATMGTALVSQSIERGQKAVKQAVVRVPEGSASTLLRRVGATGAAGGATSSVDGGPREPERSEVVGAVGEQTTEMEATTAPVEVPATQRENVGGFGDEQAASEDQGETTVPLLPTAVLKGAGVVGVTGGAGVARAAGTEGEGRGRRLSWKTLAGTAAIVFVLALGFVTAIELIANRATVFTPSTPGTPTTTTTTSTPSTTSTTTSAPTTTTTSTTAPSATTSTTAPSTTTTTNPSAASTTTTTIVP